MRWLWNLIGFACVGTGLVGIVIPGMPSTVFFIIALFSFTKGANEKWRSLLLNHPVVGPTLTHWEEHRSISRRIKWVACVSILVFCGASVWMIQNPWVKAVVAVLGLAGIAYIITRRTTEDLIARQAVGDVPPLADQLSA